jgi:hypothetical protein
MNTKKFVTAAALALSVAALPAMAVNTNGGRGKGHVKHAKNSSGGAWSSSQRSQFNQYFAQYDRNGDGVVTRNEFPADASLFNQLDLNRDGALTRAEVEQAVPNRQAAEGLARGYDRNGDGVITRNEFPGNDVAFSRLDKNRDGVISAADRGNGKSRRERD